MEEGHGTPPLFWITKGTKMGTNEIHETTIFPLPKTHLQKHHPLSLNTFHILIKPYPHPKNPLSYSYLSQLHHSKRGSHGQILRRP